MIIIHGIQDLDYIEQMEISKSHPTHDWYGHKLDNSESQNGFNDIYTFYINSYQFN